MEKEKIFYGNNKNIRDLLNKLLKEKGRLLRDGISILKALLRIGDTGAKQLLQENIMDSLNSANIYTLKVYERQMLFYFFSLEERKIFYYENNEKLKKFVEGALRYEEYALKFGFPLLLMLYNLKDDSVEDILRTGVLKWLFSGTDGTVKLLIEKYVNPILGTIIFRYEDKILEQQFKLFSYNTLKELCTDSQCPTLLIEYWKDYSDNFNKEYCYTEEQIVSKDELLRFIPINIANSLPNSQNYIIFYDRSKVRQERLLCKPINDKFVRKVIINSSESSIKRILILIEELKSVVPLLHEDIRCKHIGRGLMKNIFVLYFYAERKISLECVEKYLDVFRTTSSDLKVRIIDLVNKILV